MKKILSIVLMLSVLLSVLAIPAFATTTDAAEAANGKYFRIGDEGSGTYYATLDAAMAAVTDGGTIVQIADYTHSAKLTDFDKALTIEGKAKDAQGGKYQLEFTYSGSNDFLRNFSKNLTFKNLTIKSTKGFRPDKENVTITFDNCNITTGKTWWFCFDKAGQGVYLKDSTVLAPLSNYMMANNVNADITIILENSVITFPYESDTCQVYVTATGNTTVNIDATSKIIAKNGNYAANSATRYGMFCMDGQANGSLNLARGATVEMLVEPGTIPIAIVRSGSGTVSVNDNGANWIIGKAALAAGVTLPQISKLGESTNVIAWEIDGKLYQNEGKEIKATITADQVTAKPIALVNTNGITNVAGASIRKDTPYGIRFTTNISAALYNELAALGSSVEYGTLIAKTEKLDAENPELTVEALTEGDYVIVKKTKWAEENVNGVYSYRGAYYELENSKESFNTSYSATGVIILNFADGTTGYIYADFDKTQNSRTLNDVAVAAVATSEFANNAFLAAIIATAN